jgi:uncharacterized membrane protein
MFGILNYHNGSLLLVVLLFLVFAIVQSNKVNRWIDEFNEENSKDDVRKYKNLPHAPVVELIACIVVILLALLIPMK